MELSETIAVKRPSRWDEPMDPQMTPADVTWLRSREPFSSLQADAFPRSMPLEGILQNDCRLHRVEPGEIIVREGDYGNSAFLVLSGAIKVLVESLPPEQLGRSERHQASWGEALWSYLRRSPVPESRDPHQVTLANESGESQIRAVDDRQAFFLQDFDAVLSRSESVELGPGELFGEVAAMYRSPRNATVLAATEASLLEIRWQGLKVLRRDEAFAEKLDAHYRANWLAIHLREIPLFRFVPESNLSRVVAKTEMRSHGRMEWNADYKKSRKLAPAEQIASEPIVSDEGRYPTDLIVVRTGFGRMCQAYGAAQRTSAYLGKNHLFGLEEVVHNAVLDTGEPPMKLQNTLRAVGFLDTLHIPVEVFAEEILPFVRRSELPSSAAQKIVRSSASDQDERRAPKRTDTERTSMETAKRGLNAKADIQTGTGTQYDQTDMLEFLVQNRLTNGRQAMVIDLNRCVRCDDCVKACAATHDGNPRFVRTGIQHANLQFTQACMHCTDPVCMIGCPTGAISRDQESGVVSVHEPICVGCSVCANSCPYSNIRMAEVSDRSGKPFTDSTSGKPIMKATKCDMCHQSPTGPACMNACPHDALVRIDLNESAPLSAWLEQRS